MNDPIKLSSSDDREAWLKDRQRGITATEVAKLANGRASDRRAIKEQKISGSFVDLSGNKFIDWGVSREPVIAEWIERKFDIMPNSNAFASAVNNRHIATPDGISADAIAEIKTSQKDLTPGQSAFEASGYYDQMQWQMHVMNMTRTLFVFEQHDNDWNPYPTPYEPQHFWIERDDLRIEQLIEIADEFLFELDNTSSTVLADTDSELADLSDRLIELRVIEAEAKQNRELVWKRIQEIVEEREDFSESTGASNISWNTSTKIVDVVDMDSFREKESDIVRLYESKLADYTAKETQTKRTLTITAKK